MDDAYLYRYQQIAFGQLASLVLNMHKFGTAPAMIKQIVTRLASAYRISDDQVQMLVRDLDRRLDSENPYTAESRMIENPGLQQVVNKIIRGDTDAIRKAVAAVFAAKGEKHGNGDRSPSFSNEQLSRAVQNAIRSIHQ